MLYSHTKGYTCTLESFNFVGPIFLDCGSVSFSFSWGCNFVDASFFQFQKENQIVYYFFFVENVYS